MSIPVVDVAPFVASGAGSEAGRAAARQLSAAFEATGFAVIIGHGVDPAIGRRCWELSRDFHAQPLAAKAPLPAYRAQGGENVSQLLGVFDAKPDMVDKLSLHVVEDGALAPTRLWGDEPAPAGLGGLDAAIDAHCGALHRLYNDVLLPMGEVGLGAEEGALRRHHGRMNSYLQLSNYFQNLEEDEHRFGAHTDSACLSILRTDVPGLEVRLGGEWIGVPVVDGAFVVNVGRWLGRWTNDRWKVRAAPSLPVALR